MGPPQATLIVPLGLAVTDESGKMRLCTRVFGEALIENEQSTGIASNQTKKADVAALYARASSDLQNAASIDDQLRICAE
jgi:hypothetical protein